MTRFGRWWCHKIWCPDSLAQPLRPIDDEVARPPRTLAKVVTPDSQFLTYQIGQKDTVGSLHKDVLSFSNQERKAFNQADQAYFLCCKKSCW